MYLILTLVSLKNINMAKKSLKIQIFPYMDYGYTFLTITLLANRTEILYGNSGDYYLSIGYKETWF